MSNLEPYKAPKQPQERAIHVAQMVLAQNPVPIRPAARLRVSVTDFMLPGQLEEHEPIARASLELPGPKRGRTVMAAGPSGLEVPWDHHPNVPALLLPGPVVEELRWERRWRVAHFIGPSTVDLPFTRDALAQAAWFALSRIAAREVAITELAVLAAQVEMLGHASVREREFLVQMKLPQQLERRIHAELGPTSPLLDARCLRWIVVELCVASANRRKVPRVQLSPEAEQVVDLLFPLLGRSALAFRKELYRAVWCLHEAFALGPGAPGDAQTDDSGLSMLSMTAAHAVGVRMFGEADDVLARAAEMWAIEDEDPFIAGRGVVPSEIRDTFAQQTQLTVNAFVGLASVARYRARCAHRKDPNLREIVERIWAAASDTKRQLFVTTVRKHMTVTTAQLGSGTFAEMERYGIRYQGWGTVPQHASETLRDHPVLELPTGVLLMWAGGLFLDRAGQLPGSVYAAAHGLGRQQAKGRIGNLFEARLQHRMVDLRSRCWVATEEQIDGVVAREDQRPDGIIRSGVGNYLMVEIDASRLETGIAAGNASSVETMIDKYIRKRGQADALVANAPEVLGRLLGVDRVKINIAVPLVVADEPIPSNPAFERYVTGRGVEWRPRFLCSVEEFELLLDLGEAGWDIALMVSNWQAHGHGQMLGTFMEGALRMTPRAREVSPALMAAITEMAA